MSVMVIGKMTVDPANVQKLWAEQGDAFRGIAEQARAAGATSHRWGLGDGYVVIIDDWPDEETFNSFFGGTHEIAELMQAAGVQGPPEFQILDAASAPDAF